MDHFNRFRQYLAVNTFLAIILPGVINLAIYIWLREFLKLDLLPSIGISAILFATGATLSYLGLMRTSTKPLQMVWQAIWHVSPGKSDVPPPKLDTIKVKSARELVSAMVMQVYDLASNKSVAPAQASPNQTTPAMAPAPISGGTLLETIPLALFVLDKDWNVRAANQLAINYVGLSKDRVVGKSVHDVLNMSFKEGEDTLDGWLKSVAGNKATDSRTWEQVKLDLVDGSSKQFDMAVSYSQANSEGNEVVLAIFDQNKQYSTTDQATSYVAMAVHELRTPLTMLRGYVEMFEDEIGPELSQEHREFMRKMSASAQSLSAFVSNILSVSRIDENAFVLKLHEADWGQTLREIIANLELRAQVRGKRITLDIAENLPPVAIDRLSATEILNNLVENAIKYSGQNPDIIVSTKLGQDGMVETTVEDHGVGIPESVVGGLFTKYYRSHRSKNAVSGTGLGLYLVKAIVTAHGGSVWVNSKEGEGSRFSFTLQPFDRVKDQAGSQDGLERQASGWIKNHSMYRR